MQIQDLKTGDVLLFSPEKGSFISWAITFLTNAPVSHSAIFYNEIDQTIIEETPPQVAINPAKDRFEKRTITVKRLENQTLPLSPVINVATNYLNAEEPYAQTGLYLVGALLVYKKFFPHTLLQKVIIQILKKLTLAIVKKIDEHKTPGKLPMVCSQFVAQCYQEAGTEYELQFDNPVLATKAPSLLEQALQQKEEIMELKMNIDTEEVFPSDEELCQTLKDAFENQKNLEITVSEKLYPELVLAIAQFGQALQSTSSNEQIKTESPLEFLQKQAPLFVAPGDLLQHCPSLVEVGTIE